MGWFMKMNWTSEDVLAATGGERMGRGKDSVFGDVVTDSRRVRRGSIFVALHGERLDGHAFLEKALRRGARCLVVHRRARARGIQRVTVIKVRDTLQALGDMARFRRRKADLRVLAITGSNGKTTTKEMVASIMEQASLDGMPCRGKVLKTAGNYNNLVGLPLTLLGLTGKERIAVLELGTNRRGEIRRLTEIADPDVGLITSVAPAHLSGLGNLRGVAREKGDLFRGMAPGGAAVVNLDDPWTRRLGREFMGEKVTYGRSGTVRAERVKNLGAKGMEFTLRVKNGRRRVRIRLPGTHSLSNALGAAAMAHAVGAGLNSITRGLERVRPLPMRMTVERFAGVEIINDAYNANPASMEAALRALSGVVGTGKKVAVLGDMLELGKQSERKHRELGKMAAACRLDGLYLLGRFASQVRRGALRGGMTPDRVSIGKNHEALARRVRRETRRGDWLLFKGSRGAAMEKVLTAYKAMGD